MLRDSTRSEDERFKVDAKNEFNGSSGLTRFQARGEAARFVRPFNLASRKYQLLGLGTEEQGGGPGHTKLCLHVPFGPCSRDLPSWPCIREAFVQSLELVICPTIRQKARKRILLQFWGFLFVRSRRNQRNQYS